MKYISEKRKCNGTGNDSVNPNASDKVSEAGVQFLQNLTYQIKIETM